MRRGVRSFFCGATLLLAAGSAFGSLGSVISSFWVADNYHYFAYGVARDDTYVYWVSTELYPGYFLYYGNPNGGPGGSVRIGAFAAAHDDADVSLLGSGYFADIYTVGGVRSITDFDVSTGSAVASWAPFSDIQSYAYSPVRRIRYVGNSSGYVHRYNTAGSLINSFPTPERIRGLAASEEFAGARGEYIIVTQSDYWYVCTSQGGQVARVPFPSETGMLGEIACGRGYPSEYGTTLWCVGLNRLYHIYVYQISLHNATAVTPASVGKIKALFR
jgi:hypothetical protein